MAVIYKTIRSRFIEILLNNPKINSLPQKKMRGRIEKIMTDLDVDGVLDPINIDEGFDEYDNLEQISNIEFNTDLTDNEKKIALEFLTKPKAEKQLENGTIISLQSLERIRQKRRELAQDPDSEIVLTEDDFEENERNGDVVMPNTYGRSPLHEAIGMRNLKIIKEYVLKGLHLAEIDNNGNTPYQMAFQEGYSEAIKIFVAAKVAI